MEDDLGYGQRDVVEPGQIQAVDEKRDERPGVV